MHRPGMVYVLYRPAAASTRGVLRPVSASARVLMILPCEHAGWHPGPPQQSQARTLHVPLQEEIAFASTSRAASLRRPLGSASQVQQSPIATLSQGRSFTINLVTAALAFVF